MTVPPQCATWILITVMALCPAARARDHSVTMAVAANTGIMLNQYQKLMIGE